MISESAKGNFPMPSNKRMISERIIKYSNSSAIDFVKMIASDQYIISETMNLQWKLIPEFKTIMNYKTQKTTIAYSGRNWTAWFSKDIPFQNGPYKFGGLPGLILEMEDSTKSHYYIITAIKSIQDDFTYPVSNNNKEIKISHPQYIKLYKNYRVNPVAHLVGKIPDLRISMELQSVASRRSGNWKKSGKKP
ncbi:GLPGLI family protein [Chryseobacterium sp. RP-3-3]|uniref:GLPGLI family protein n=1 Tax=Chryseobacterium antibioticum TaxID=2728847 RepID=A0A7Y0APJ1_9FLAO|nr:GLPGLI family protein [Chryseobacterium antibioticum]NML71110.1 GLPGLI family protein [Chryseobacterium antibioticum]